MTPTPSPEIKPGDEVRLFAYGTRAGRNFPEGGHRGMVTWAGLKYATATFELWPGEASEISFNMLTGRERDGAGRYYVRTPEQMERDKRSKEGLSVLAAAGIEFKPGRAYKLTLEQIEALAEVVTTWGQEGLAMLTVEDGVRCSAVVVVDEDDAYPCGAPSRYQVARSDGNESYGINGGSDEACEEHLAETVAGMVDGDTEVTAFVTIRWDA